MSKKFDVIIVGGGAAGFFTACNLLQNRPSLRVCILEKSSKVLSKVRISGGGRCNFTHSVDYNSNLLKSYPSGRQLLKKVFKKFSHRDTLKWFQNHGMEFKVEEDGRMFPVSNKSETVIEILTKNSLEKGVQLITSCSISDITLEDESALYNVATNKGRFIANKLVMAMGGVSGNSQRKLLQAFQHPLIESVPSLFTFNVPKSDFSDLQGVAVTQASVTIAGEKLNYKGPLLITHWGLSGPAVLKISAWGARLLHDKSYKFDVLVNWEESQNEESFRSEVLTYRKAHPKKNVHKNSPFNYPSRLWKRFCELATVGKEKSWNELSKKEENKLMEYCLRTPFTVSGKTTYKEEFVTSGGVDCSFIDPSSMCSKLHPNLYFTGEVLDIDGITGGFNFQAAWSTAYVVAQDISSKIESTSNNVF